MSLAPVRRIFTALSVSLIHGVFMLFLSTLWLGIGFSIGLEEQLFKVSATLKRVFTNDAGARKKLADKYCFVDVSGNIITRDRGDGTGNDVVTDRQTLSAFLEVLARHHGEFKFLLCDVLLNEPGAGDSALASQFYMMTDYVTPYYLENGTPRLPGLNIPAENMGFAGYDVSHGLEASDKLLKYQLYYNGLLKSIPQAVYEALSPNGAEVECRYGLLWINGRPHFNTIIFDLLMRPAEPQRGRDGVVISSLNYISTLLKVNEQLFFDSTFKDKIIVLGNYKTDLHETVYGQLPGPLILANIYEGISQDKHRITTWWIVTMIIAFSGLSYLVFYFSAHRRLKHAIIRNPWGRKMLRFLSISMAIWGISLFSFFIFDVHADIIVMIIYMSLVRLIIRKWPPLRLI